MLKKLSSDKTHNRWDKDLPPVLHVDPGDLVEIETKEGSDGDVRPDSGAKDVAKSDPNKVHPLSGPIYINGAKKGDTLVVRVVNVEPGSWGWTGIIPGSGYLKDEFRDPHLVIWKVNRKSKYAYSDAIPGVRIPLSPFCGVMGVALPDSGSFVTIPPRDSGGNMDIKYLTAGATLYLPVFVDGALFSVGDAHAAMGGGEVCLTGIESPAKVTLRFDLKKNCSIQSPRFETREYYGSIGYGKTLDEAMRKALMQMIDFLVEQKGLERNNAYVLCSVAADFRVCEVVDEPHLLISGLLPKRIFAKKQKATKSISAI